MSSAGWCAAKPRSAKQDAVKMGTTVSLPSLCYLKATISYICLWGRKKGSVEVLLFILLIVFRVDHASEKMRASLIAWLYSNSRTEMPHTFLAFWWEVFRAVLLGFSCVSLTVCSDDWAGGCLQLWDLWGRLLHLLGLAQAMRICWTETYSVLSAKESEAVGGLVCDGLSGLHLLSQCKLFVPKVMLHSQYNENGVSEWMFCPWKPVMFQGMLFLSSGVQFMCIPACLLDIPQYPIYEQVLGPVVIFGNSRCCWTLLLQKKKKKFYKTGGRLSMRTVFY